MQLPLTDDDGRFNGPEEAAFHACFIQDGFSTPKREAARMIRDGGVSAQRAREWMAREGLTDDDLEWN